MYNENFRVIDGERLKSLFEFGRSHRDQEHPWKLTEKRVEDAWFLYQLVQFYADRQLLDEIDFFTDSSPSQRKDLELLCSRAWERIVDITNPWVHHKCKTKGCSEGIIMTVYIHTDLSPANPELSLTP